MTNELSKPNDAGLAAPDYRDLMRAALDKGTEGVEALERLVALQERWEERNAARAFNDALRDFQRDCPAIKKSKTAQIVSKRSGSRWSYTFAPLEEITRTIRPILERYGLSYSWDSTVTDKALACVCTVRHVDGHSITATFSCPVEMSDQRSIAQNHAATLTYARRQSLVQALGLTTADDDHDGAPDADEADCIDDKEALALEARADDVGADKPALLKWAGAASFKEFPRHKLAEANSLLDRKAKAAR